MSEVSDIRRVAVTLVKGRPGIANGCSQWTTRHAEIVRSEELGPWFYMSLKGHSEAGLAPDLLDGFQQDYRFSAISSLHREVALRKLLAAFNTRSIPVILLKGTYLGHIVYKDPALRPMADVDLLVREELFEAAGRESERLGYQLVAEPNPEEDSLLKLSRVYGLLDPVPRYIDLHRRIQSMDYYHFPAGIIWEDAVQGELYGCQVFFLSPELNFIHLALHNLNHRGLLRDWLDLLVLQDTINLNWDRLLLLAQSLGVMRPLFWVFRELQAEWETPAPENVSASLRSYVPRRLEDRVIRHRLRYPWRLVARIAGLDGWRTRLRYFAAKLVPPRYEPGRARILSWVSHFGSKMRLFRHFWRRS